MNQETELFSEILPNLFMGGTDEEDIILFPKDLPGLNEREGFDSVVTCYSYAQPMSWYVHENRFGFADGSLDQETIQKIVELASWLYSEWATGKKCLIRCQAGWNRYGIVMAAVLINHGFTAKEAVRHIREKRSPNALNNHEFEAWLSKYADERLCQVVN